MAEFITSRIKYIYLDVVGFTHNRPVEAQVRIVSALNDIVKRTLAKSFPKLDVIYIPIGDGICICLLDSKVYDDYIIIAEEIIRRVNAVYNPSVKQSLQFRVRIGINENVDNIITDINGNRNVCGSGVNDAQRIMNFGDSNHILVGRGVADSLMPREKYSKAFRRYIGKAKHDTQMEIYQYIGVRVAALNRDPPAAFAPPVEKPLTEGAAYYIATLLRNRKFIARKLQQKPPKARRLAVQMAYLAEDSLGRSEETKFKPYRNRMPETPKNTLQEQFEFFCKLPATVCTDLHLAKVFYKLNDSYSDCFEQDPKKGTFVIPSKKGEQRLKKEWPEIYKEFTTQ
jgi:hypothetical protein